MRLFVLALLGSFLGILGSSGCRGSVDAPACAASFTPCGGDPTGTWTYAEACNAGSVMSASCPTATSDLSSNVSGTYTFNADKTFSTEATVAETGTETIPTSCLGTGVTCSDLMTNMVVDGLTVQETCTGTTTCTCTVSISGTLDETGTWAMAGNDLVITPKGGKASTPAGYCVSGDQLEIGGAVMGGASANAYSVFTK